MSDNNFNNNNYSTEDKNANSYNGGYSQYGYTNQQAQFTTQPAKAPKKKSRAGFAAGIIAAALVVGGAAGFGGTILGNNIITIPTNGSSDSSQSSSSSSDASSQQESTTAPATTIDTSKTANARPLDEIKINDSTNSTLLTAEELYAKVQNTVVLLYNYQNAQGYSEPVKAGGGSGIVFTSDGYIITNAHVVSGAVKMTAVVPDYDNPEESHEYEATVVGSDTASDLAVLKVNRDEPFEYALLGDSDTVRVGQDICVLGNPKQLTNSLTKGIVSGLGRASYTGSGFACSSIQIDAPVNSGNSGGAVFDMYGNVIGVVDYKLSNAGSTTTIEGIGFAITINEAKPVINDLMTSGYVTNRPGLGINGEAVSEYSAYMSGLSSAGVYVTYISEDKPVAKSGLRVGDIITAIDGTSVTTLTDVQNEISKHKIGDTVELTIYRRNEIGNYNEAKVTVELSELTLD